MLEKVPHLEPESFRDSHGLPFFDAALPAREVRNSRTRDARSCLKGPGRPPAGVHSDSKRRFHFPGVFRRPGPDEDPHLVLFHRLRLPLLPSIFFGRLNHSNPE